MSEKLGCCVPVLILDIFLVDSVINILRTIFIVRLVEPCPRLGEFAADAGYSCIYTC